MKIKTAMSAASGTTDMKNNKIGFGILGSGAASKIHIDAINDIEGAVIVGFFSPDNNSAKELTDNYGLKRFDTYEKMLDDTEIEVVCICTPSGLHAQQAIEAMNHGKHVIVEKPLAITIEDCRKIVESSEKTGCKCAVISQLRYLGDIPKAKEIINAQKLGTITNVGLHMRYNRSAEYYASSPWRGTWAMDGGGALMNQGIHGVDLLRYLCGEVKSVKAYCKTIKHNIEVEDTAVAILEFQNGALGIIEASTAVYKGYTRKLNVSGTAGAIRLEEYNLTRCDLEDSTYPKPEIKNSEIKSGASEPGGINHAGHKNQLMEMMNAIRYNMPIISDANSGMKTIELICAIYESSKTGKTVFLNK